MQIKITEKIHNVPKAPSTVRAIMSSRSLRSLSAALSRMRLVAESYLKRVLRYVYKSHSGKFIGSCRVTFGLKWTGHLIITQICEIWLQSCGADRSPGVLIIVLS